MYTRFFYTSICLTLVFASASSADIVYVDATWGAGGNTTQWNGVSYSSFTPSTDQSGTDNQWRSRVFGNAGSILESGGDISGDGNNNPENAPRLRTQIGGLSAGVTYNVYAYFWSAITGGTPDWRMRASLIDPGPSTALPLFTRLGEGGATEVTDSAGFTSTIMFSESNRRLFQASLGTATANLAGEISVFIDDDSPRPDFSQNFRTWYDGVGVSAIPEPASFVFLFAGASLVLMGRRRPV